MDNKEKRGSERRPGDSRCWILPKLLGKPVIDGKFVKAVQDKQVAINNGDSTSNRAFIQEFVKTHLEPITLKNHDVYNQCPVCKVKYAKAS